MQNKVYCQMYSILRTSREGLLDALKSLSEMGYNGIEGMGDNTEGLSRAEFKSYVNSLGLDCISFHSLKDDAMLSFGQEMGARFTDIRPAENLKTVEDVKRAADELNRQARHIAKFGMKAVVHNHATEFRRPADSPDLSTYELLLLNTDPEYVGFELDIGWAQLAGVNCGELIRKYAGRFPLLHVKECNRVAKSDDELEHFPKFVMEMMKVQTAAGDNKSFIKGAPAFSPEQMEILYESRNWNVSLGEGLVDWADIRSAAEAQGVAAYINEREYYTIGGKKLTPLECARMDCDFLKQL